jgi:hypothetical protein
VHDEVRGERDDGLDERGGVEHVADDGHCPEGCDRGATARRFRAERPRDRPRMWKESPISWVGGGDLVGRLAPAKCAGRDPNGSEAPAGSRVDRREGCRKIPPRVR